MSWTVKCAIALALTCFCVMKAHATSTFDCVADDSAIDLNIMGHLGVGVGDPIGDVMGEIKEKNGHLTRGAKIIKFGKNDLTQYWSAGSDFRLRFYLVQEDLEIVIETQASSEDDNNFTGSYMFLPESAASSKEVISTFKRSISCFID